MRNLTKGENGDAALEGRGQRNSELGMRNAEKDRRLENQKIRRLVRHTNGGLEDKKVSLPHWKRRGRSCRACIAFGQER